MKPRSIIRLNLFGANFLKKKFAKRYPYYMLPDCRKCWRSNRGEDESTAYKLASYRSRLVELKACMGANLQPNPLFETQRLNHHFEQPFSAMYVRHPPVLPTTDIQVSA